VGSEIRNSVAVSVPKTFLLEEYNLERLRSRAVLRVIPRAASPPGPPLLPAGAANSRNAPLTFHTKFIRPAPPSHPALNNAPASIHGRCPNHSQKRSRFSFFVSRLNYQCHRSAVSFLRDLRPTHESGHSLLLWRKTGNILTLQATVASTPVALFRSHPVVGLRVMKTNQSAFAPSPKCRRIVWALSLKFFLYFFF